MSDDLAVQESPPAKSSASTGALTPYRPTVSLNYMQQLALSAAQSGMFKRFGNQHAAFMVLQFGFDLGLSPSAALSSIYFYDGKPSMSGNLMWSLVKNHPDWRKSKILERTDKCVKIRWVGPDGPEGESCWTEEDAKKAGLTTKDNWRKYPRQMLFNRAVSEGFKLYCPHLANGYTIYTPDELGQDINEDGGIAEGSFTVLNSLPQVPAHGSVPAQKPAYDLDALLEKAGWTLEEAAKVMDLTPEELKAPTPDEWKRLNEFANRRVEVRNAAKR